VDFAPGQRASPQRIVCEAFLANKNIAVLELPPYSPTCSLRLLPLPKDQVRAQRNPFCVGRTRESKNGGDTQQPYRT